MRVPVTDGREVVVLEARASAVAANLLAGRARGRSRRASP